jgi:hypothetical protein
MRTWTFVGHFAAGNARQVSGGVEGMPAAGRAAGCGRHSVAIRATVEHAGKCPERPRDAAVLPPLPHTAQHRAQPDGWPHPGEPEQTWLVCFRS